MKTIKAVGVVALLFGGVELAFAQGKLESVYTDLATRKCKTITVDRETGSSTQSCRGIAGHRLLVHDDDARQSITVVTPDGKKHDLNFWQVITGGFSSLGTKAEWRVVRKNGKLSPLALIVRVNANEHPDNPNRVTSYLAVTKLTPNKICVTHKITQSPNANSDARHAADSAGAAECLKEPTP
ncbi:MAG: hypothetical protein ACREBG_27315 [Pyrinomonadaceae bacterium]